MNMHRLGKSLSYPIHMFPVKVIQGDTLPLVSALINKCFSHDLFCAMFLFILLCILLVILSVKMAFKCSVEGLCRVIYGENPHVRYASLRHELQCYWL